MTVVKEAQYGRRTTDHTRAACGPHRTPGFDPLLLHDLIPELAVQVGHEVPGQLSGAEWFPPRG
jgi:hypothetical protein